MIRSILQGRPFGLPLHALLVHLPIGLLLLSFILDIVSYATSANVLVRASFVLMSLGVLTALLAALPGIVDYFEIRQDHPAKKTATTHMLLNLAVVALYIVNVLLRGAGARLLQPTPDVLAFFLSIIGIVVLGYSGYLGGKMVYDDGIGVGRHRRKAALPDRTIHASGDGFVDLAPADQLPEGGTLRAEVNGFVLTVAHSGGRAFAFQEFCTHRCGPLSEGCFVDGGSVVKCPWHGSEFDMRNGKVVSGPAKVELKTFEVELRGGRIFVRTPAPAAFVAGQGDAGVAPTT